MISVRGLPQIQGEGACAVHITLDATDVGMIVEALEEVVDQMRK